ncbi:hypothetical protein [Bremerella sp.]|uniref:hypothetical protein n=1 Tax=Bremerella sp. TaxID=2795602 RepID=UPI00391CD1CD
MFVYLYIVQASAIGFLVTGRLVPTYLKIALSLGWCALVFGTARDGYDAYGLSLPQSLAAASIASWLLGLLGNGAHHLLYDDSKYQLTLRNLAAQLTYVAVLLQMINWSTVSANPFDDDLDSRVSGLLFYGGFGVIGGSLYLALTRTFKGPFVDGAGASLSSIFGAYLMVYGCHLIGDARAGTPANVLMGAVVYGAIYMVYLGSLKGMSVIWPGRSTEDL